MSVIGTLRASSRLSARFVSVTGELLLRPSRFFERFHLEGGGLRLPVLYAICTHWIAALLVYSWEGALFARLKSGLSDILLLLGDAHELGHPGRVTALAPEMLSQIFQEQLLPWFWGASAVLLSPFKTLATLTWAAGVLFVASRLLIPTRVTLKGSIRIACFASTAVLWKAIPVIGPFLSQFMLLLTTVVALKKSYNIGTLRASAVALFPQLLVMLAMLALLFGLGWILVGGLVSALSGATSSSF